MKSKILKVIRNKRYHLRHKKEAKAALYSIEKYKGKLPNKLKKQCDEYALEVLGSKKYAPWLYVYSCLNGEFKKGWLPDNYYGLIIVPLLKGDYKIISDISCIQSKLLNNNFLPDLAYFINGLWLDQGGNVIGNSQVKQEIGQSKVVFKKDFSSQGRGVTIFDNSEFDIEKAMRKGNGCLQYFIKQNPFFNKITPDSVATIRVTTYYNKDDNKVDVAAVYLRLGRKNEKHIKSTTTIRVAINKETGEFDKYGYSSQWERFTSHPDSFFEFKNNFIPHYNKCIDVVSELHKSVSFIRIIGWDVIVDNNNDVKVMEWNGGHNDIKFTEAVQGPSFKNYGFEKLWNANSMEIKL